MKNSKKKLKPEVLISCLDVLCRANATVVESDPKLACDIFQAIESLTCILQSQEQSLEEEEEFRREDDASKYVREHEDAIVDVLTNEVIYKHSQLDNK